MADDGFTDEILDDDDEEFDDDVVVDYEEPEPVLQRCLNLVLDRFGYFQDDDDVEEDEEPVGEEAEGAVNIRQPSGLLNRVCLAFLLPFKFVFNLLLIFYIENFFFFCLLKMWSRKINFQQNYL